MASIKAIDSTSVHRLHAGQVVLELQGAIKELVENSLDAGATSIDVKIKDNGLDTIEVADNGSGIAEADWAMIGRKHHTSKLAEISALAEVSTFGFRGEALSSLCALCDSVTVTTATKETAPMAAVLQLGRDGTTKDDTARIARPRGTTITLSGLFVPLPVRRKEFERTVKREYAKALSLLYAYALVPSSVASSDGRNGVRLKVEAVGTGRSGTTLLATDGRGSLRSSVTAIWGPKALEGVQDINLELEVEVDSVMARREGISNDAQHVKVAGLISSGAWGQGRTSADRQFYYVNGRPCDLKQVGKAINEVYKSFNTNQVPMAILDFQIPAGSVDINVSPDKRTIFLHSEANLITALRSALEEFFAPSRSSYVIDGASHTVKVLQPTPSLLPILRPTVQDEVVEEDETMEDVGEEEKDDLESLEDDVEPMTRHTREIPSMPSGNTVVYPTDRTDRRVKRTLDTARASWSPSVKSSSHRTSNGRASTSTAREPTEKAKLRQRLSAFASQPLMIAQDGSEDDDVEEDEVHVIGTSDAAQLVGNDNDEPARADTSDTAEDTDVDDDDDVDDGQDEMTRGSPSNSHMDGGMETPAGEEDERLVSDAAMVETVEARETNIGSNGDLMENETLHAEDSTDPIGSAVHSGTGRLRQEGSRGLYRDEISSTSVLGEMTLRVDVDRLKRRYEQVSHDSKSTSSPRTAFAAISEGSLTAEAGIQNRDMAKAEQALSRVISKSDFAKMEVLGQFNKGFIIARLRTDHDDLRKRQSDDLFIIDQHASDEKFNFETLQRTTVIKAQALIKPRPLQLTAGDEILAIENLDILKTNGFEVTVDEEKAPGRGERIALSAMPVSKETTFDFKDLEQLLHLLSDGARPAGQMVRCSKARSMFAMRACRKSVMIGKSLSLSQMTNLLKNMGTIDQPWNCPHGRPTMRHLTKMEDKVKRGRSGRTIDWAHWAAKEIS